MLALLVGLVLGYVGSIPAAGPLAMLIVSAALDRDRTRALRLAVGGAVAEGIWAAVALLGVQRVLTIPGGAPLTAIRVVGCVVLCGLGASMLRARPLSPREPTHADVVLGFVLVATNPGFLVAWTGFAALLASHGLLHPHARSVMPTAVGAVLGIVAWFVTLYALVGRLRERFTERVRVVITRVLGVAMIGFGIALVVRALFNR